MRQATEKRAQEDSEEAARAFAEGLVEAFGNAVNAVVLYGSVAAESAGEGSDVDVLVLTEADHPDRSDVIDLADSVDFSTGYESYVVPLVMSSGKLQGLYRQGFPVARAILSEGVSIYDDGTFKRIREASFAAGGRNAN
jgi:predicted nucleotidyltransferase